MNLPQTKETIKELVDFITKETTNNHLGLSMTHYFKPRTKSWDPRMAEFDDIGDYQTFVAWAGKIFKQDNWVKFPQNQLAIWKNHFQTKRGWYICQVNLDKIMHKGTSTNTISIYSLQDAILGFYELYLLTEDKQYKDELESQFILLENLVNKHSGWLPNTIINRLEIAVPWASASPAVAGLIAEHAFLWSKLTKNNRWQKLGRAIVKPWLETPLWQNESLFHQGYNVFIPGFSPYKETKIMKENSNLIYAMLQQPKEYAKEIKLFTNKLLAFQYKNGAFYGHWNVKTNQIKKEHFDKTQNFTIIDLLLDIYRTNHENTVLLAAEKCAAFWIAHQHPKTKLISDYVIFNNQIQTPIAKLDQSADLYTSFLRLYSLTGKRIYLTTAQHGATSLKRYFGQDKWWHRIITVDEGKVAENNDVPLKDRPANVNLTKYIGGALKFYLSLYQVTQGKSMYKDRLLQLLSRDR